MVTGAGRPPTTIAGDRAWRRRSRPRGRLAYGNLMASGSVSVVVVLILSLGVSIAGTTAQDVHAMPWLDRPIGRFFSPSIYGDPYGLGEVFDGFVKQARIRASLEFRSTSRADGPRWAPLDFAIAEATPRRVLSEIATRWAPTNPIVNSRQGEFLCLAEKALLEDPAWPLNVGDVAGFRVERASFGRVCARAVEAIAKACSRRSSPQTTWNLELGEPPRGEGLDFSQHPPSSRRPITADIEPGHARQLLCQVAMLQPNCYWGAVAMWESTAEDTVDGEAIVSGRGKRARVMFSSWSDRHGTSTRQLLADFARTVGSDDIRGAEGIRRDVTRELQRRGPRAARATVSAYKATPHVDVRLELLGLMERLCAWPDATDVIREFLAHQDREPSDLAIKYGLDSIEGAIALAERLEQEGRVALPEEGRGADDARSPLPALLYVLTGLGVLLMASATAFVLLRRARQRRHAHSSSGP